jgi:4-hydroxybenzoate polyprenyltransferase
MANLFMELIRLFRVGNLIIIALTQVFIRYAIIAPILEKVNVTFKLNNIYFIQPQLLMSHLDFALLVISTVFIAAGGYVINDYFDTKTDRINKPERLIVGKTIKRRAAMGMHIVLNSIAILLAAYLCFKSGNYQLIFIQLFSIVSLWFYSTTFKKQLLVGNIIIAGMAALVPMTVALYEFSFGGLQLVQLINGIEAGAGSRMLIIIVIFVMGYSIFSFLINIIREIIKDSEDADGDFKTGGRTLPISVGLKTTRYIILTLILVTIVLLAFVQQSLLETYKLKALFYYLLLAVQIPLVYLAFLSNQAVSKQDFSRMSLICKLIILTGVLSMPLIWWTI